MSFPVPIIEDFYHCLKRLYTPSCVHLSHGSVPTYIHAHSCTVTLSYTITELKGTHISVITLTQRKGRKKCGCSIWGSFSVGRWPIMSTHSKIPCPGHPALEGPVLTTCSLSTPVQTPPRLWGNGSAISRLGFWNLADTTRKTETVSISG